VGFSDSYVRSLPDGLRLWQGRRSQGRCGREPVAAIGPREDQNGMGTSLRVHLGTTRPRPRRLRVRRWRHRNHWVLDTSVFHHMASAPAVHPNWEANGILTAVGLQRRSLAGRPSDEGIWRENDLPPPGPASAKQLSTTSPNRGTSVPRSGSLPRLREFHRDCSGTTTDRRKPSARPVTTTCSRSCTPECASMFLSPGPVDHPCKSHLGGRSYPA
jgi:hypothetical protein